MGLLISFGGISYGPITDRPLRMPLATSNVEIYPHATCFVGVHRWCARISYVVGYVLNRAAPVNYGRKLRADHRSALRIPRNSSLYRNTYVS